jgi:uncharacterized protein (DUF2235 family)
MSDLTLYKLIMVCFISALTGCSAVPVVTPSSPLDINNKNIVLFFDGTNNQEDDNTNVHELRNLMQENKDPRLHLAYIQGVGTEGGPLSRIGGLAFGSGLKGDVKHGYAYLAETYNNKKDDNIFIFGFSRGSYSARVLAGLLSVAGLPDISKVDKNERSKLYDSIFKAYTSKSDKDERLEAVLKVKHYSKASGDVRIKFMGLWDTVSSLGLPNWLEDTTEYKALYIDQLCNIDGAAHALSIDDNRATIFTPVLLTSKELISDCPTYDINKRVNEVWFSGAHSDVGGGYPDADGPSLNIGGISLNWMLYQLEPFDLLVKKTRVPAAACGKTHAIDARGSFFGWLFGIAYENRNRNFPYYYTKDQNKGYNNGKPKIHRSVIDRLTVMNKLSREFDWISDFNINPDNGGYFLDTFEKKHDVTNHYQNTFREFDGLLDHDEVASCATDNGKNTHYVLKTINESRLSIHEYYEILDDNSCHKQW